MRDETLEHLRIINYNNLRELPHKHAIPALLCLLWGIIFLENSEKEKPTEIKTRKGLKTSLKIESSMQRWIIKLRKRIGSFWNQVKVIHNAPHPEAIHFFIQLSKGLPTPLAKYIEAHKSFDV